MKKGRKGKKKDRTANIENTNTFCLSDYLTDRKSVV